MQSLPAPGAHPVVSLIDGHAVTTSQNIAEVFGKRHDSVLHTIRSIHCSPDFRLHNFVETVETRVNPSGGVPIESPVYRLTRDGCVRLIMGFTGKRAAIFKEAYIAEFNRLEALLRQPPDEKHALLAHSVAALAGTTVQLDVYRQLLARRDRVAGRYLLMVSADGAAQMAEVGTDAVVGSLSELATMLADPAAQATDAELADLAKACTDRLAQRLRRRAI